MTRTNVNYLWRTPGAAEGYSYGVSLHSHTTHSRESLEFIPKYARKQAILSKVMDYAEWQYTRRTKGKPMNCARAWWTPPLTPAMALDLEAGQIHKHANLPALVSFTDHDNCEAGLEIDGTVSIEWTIPSAPSFFHMGVHNLPKLLARDITAEMNAFTRAPQAARLMEMLTMLNGYDDVLLVLNHPLWDEGLIGEDAHGQLLETFLQSYAPWIHALELNGLRCAAENERVLAAAARYNLPAISGGDRHGREPNANVNLTRATTFADFVREVRCDKRSEVLFMPQYREPLRLRQFETAWDILRYDADRPDGRHSWCDRVYFLADDDVVHPLSHFFGQSGPKIIMPLLAVMHLLEKPAVRPMLRAALGD